MARYGLGMRLIHLPNFIMKLDRRCYSSKNILGLRERGLLQDIFPAACPKFSEVVAPGRAAVYAGFDPTSDSLHVGNLLVITAMLHFQRAGHQVIAVLGGATAQIGDPSGKTTERPALDATVIQANARSIESSLRRIFDNHEKLIWKKPAKEPLYPIKFVNNLEWYNRMNVIEFLCNVGIHFRMGMMLSKSSVQSRLNSSAGINFKEFSYQAFQAYDWLHLLKHHNCVVQVGGIDQLGNIHSGYELISRVERQNVYGVMVPLITSETGAKFGKTAGNAVCLNSEKSSCFDFYQFFTRMKDSEIERYLKLFTFYPLAEIEDIMRQHEKYPESRYAQNKCAEAVTLLVHGEAGLISARRITNAFYSKTPEALFELGEEELHQVFNDAKAAELLLQSGTTVLEMALKAGCFPNEIDARRIIEAGGFYVNHRRVTFPDYVLVPGEHILPNNLSLLRCGKKNYYVIKWL